MCRVQNVDFTFAGVHSGQNIVFSIAGKCSGQNVGFTFAGMSCSVVHCSELCTLVSHSLARAVVKLLSSACMECVALKNVVHGEELE
jgi:dissimilatory sulfite reductase (desulfoviridin) alpha/beta subunit